LTIDLHAVEKGGKHTIAHDLNFAQPRYEAKHVINFKNPNPNLLDVLRKSGPVPDDANGARKKGGDADARKKKKTGQVDMDRLADGLVKLQEDDLLQVVQMIHDNKSDETYTKNDVDRKSQSRPILLVKPQTPGPETTVPPKPPGFTLRYYPKPPPRLWRPKSPVTDDTVEGEFHVDLYTLPDALVRMLWDFVQSKA
jgi:transcription initiation factor IIF auxiliary subunit